MEGPQASSVPVPGPAVAAICPSGWWSPSVHRDSISGREKSASSHVRLKSNKELPGLVHQPRANMHISESQQEFFRMLDEKIEKRTFEDLDLQDPQPRRVPSSQFCNALYVGLPLKTVRILQLVQNRAVRLLTGTGHYSHMTSVLRQLHWLPTEVRAQFKVLMMTYKALNGLGPGYLKERLRPYMPSRPLRSATDALLWEPSMNDIRRVSTRRRAFSAVAPHLWNVLPREVCLAPSLFVFRRWAKTFLFKTYFKC
ncbi:hypothetical protein EYD10_12087 [Varanus komodoensis]|nr:hypothetical protein EYD10_12087 [Varanus komodoensis]